MRETRITALLGYLMALNPAPYLKLFRFPGVAGSVTLENWHDSGLRDPAILCAHSLHQTSVVITTLFNSVESLIEMNLFEEVVRMIESTFDRLGERKR